MAFTKVVGAGIHTLSNITSHNINSSGIITATKFVGPFDGTSGTFSGNVTIGGNLSVAQTVTYEDVKNVDSVGVGTFREGIFLPDEKKAEFGNTAGSGDLQIYHSPSNSNNSFIKHTGSGVLKIAADHFRFRNAADSANLFNGIAGDAITLYFAGQEKLKTTSDGIEIPDAIRHLSDANTAIRFPADDTIRFEVGNQQAVHILPASAGSGGARMGLGTNSPTGMLHIYGSNPPFRIQNSNDSANLQIGMWDTANVMFQVSHRPFKLATETSHPIVFHTGGLNNERLRITSDGNIGVNQTEPAYKLVVNEETTVGTAHTVLSALNPIVYIDAGNEVDHNIVLKKHTTSNGDIIGGLLFASSPDGANYNWTRY